MRCCCSIPNTGTLPLFRSRRDAEITLACYRRPPVLVRDGEAVTATPGASDLARCSTWPTTHSSSAPQSTCRRWRRVRRLGLADMASSAGCRCTRPRCSATGTTGTPPTPTPLRPSSACRPCRASATYSSTTPRSSRLLGTGWSRAKSTPPYRTIGNRLVPRLARHRRPGEVAHVCPKHRSAHSRRPQVPTRYSRASDTPVAPSRGLVVDGVRLHRPPEAQRHQHDVLHCEAAGLPGSCDISMGPRRGITMRSRTSSGPASLELAYTSRRLDGVRRRRRRR